MSKRRNHDASFKARVALETVKGARTVSELATEYDVHPTMIHQWSLEGGKQFSESFSRQTRCSRELQHLRTQREEEDRGRRGEGGSLHAKIGELVVTNVFLSRKLKPWTGK